MRKEIDLKHKKPILAYVGMDRRTVVEAAPTQVIEVVYPSKAEKKDETGLFVKGERQAKIVKQSYLPKNRLIWTNDNLVALKTLLDEKDPVSGEFKYRNKIDLIYIDPPFMVQDDFVAQNSIDIEVDKEEDVVSVKEPTIIETIAYKDTWQNGLDSFLQMIRERLLLMKELLAPTGSIYVHLDWHTSHYVKVLMDEIFDYSFFRNEIIWRRVYTHSDAGKFGHIHDVILFYTKTDDYNWNDSYTEHDSSYIESHYKKDSDGRYFQYISMSAKTGKPEVRIINGKEYLPDGNAWKYSQKTIDQYWKEGKIDFTSQGTPRLKVYLDQFEGKKVQTIWTDIFPVNSQAVESTGYPTQKPVSLLNRIISASCLRNGIILDAFMGSGTTCEAAEQLVDELNCTWIGIDNSKFAIHTARKRLIELNGKPKPEKDAGIYKVRPFTVENIGYYQRNAQWDAVQISKHADAYRQAIIELFGGEFVSYSKLLHGKKGGAWIHVGPLSVPIISEQLRAIAEEVKATEFKKCYVLSADFTAYNQTDIQKIKDEFGIQMMVRLIPASAIEEVKKRLSLMKQGVKDPEKISEMPNLAFFAPLVIKIHKTTEGKEVAIELSGLEVDVQSFLDSQNPERHAELKKWLDKEKSWKSFVDFWAIDWDYESLKDTPKEPIFENEWQSFRKKSGKKVVKDLVFKAFHKYEKPGEYTIAVKVTDVFGNDGIVTTKIVIK